MTGNKKDMSERLTEVLNELAVARGDAFSSFGDSDFHDHELDWRAKKPRSTDLLEGDPDDWRAVQRFMHSTESGPLRKRVGISSTGDSDIRADLEGAREHLNKVVETFGSEWDPDADGDLPDEAEERFQAWKDFLPETYSGRSPSWPMVTAPLTLAAPESLPWIRPSRFSEPRAEQLLQVEYDSTPSTEKYAEYIAALAELRAAFREKGFDVESTDEGTAYLLSQFVIYITYRPDLPAPESRQLLNEGHHIVLQGPPGTGKTFTAERLGSSIERRSKDEADDEAPKDGGAPRDSKRLQKTITLDEFLDLEVGATSAGKTAVPQLVPRTVVEFVQFHASYDYEDFVRGYRPTTRGPQGELGFEAKDGPLAKMLTLAEIYAGSDWNFLLVVDEINRADIARVLGESIYLFDRRSDGDETNPNDRTSLRYEVDSSHEKSEPDDHETVEDVYAANRRNRLTVPSNFYFVGTMNTADRSTAVVDMALRRRFAFVDVEPNWETAQKEGGLDKLSDGNRKQLKKIWQALNGPTAEAQMAADGLVRDDRFAIGHSYFMAEPTAAGEELETDQVIRDIHHKFNYQLLPLLREYEQQGQLRSEIDASYLDTDGPITLEQVTGWIEGWPNNE